MRLRVCVCVCLCVVFACLSPGHFVEGKKQGKGTFRWEGGATYEGSFYEDNLHGHGKFKVQHQAKQDTH